MVAREFDIFGAPTGGTLTGDVNRDGVSNLVDIAPFVGVIANGGFQAEADLNLDGVINLLDVQLFVLALLGGSYAWPW